MKMIKPRPGQETGDPWEDDDGNLLSGAGRFGRPNKTTGGSRAVREGRTKNRARDREAGNRHRPPSSASKKQEIETGSTGDSKQNKRRRESIKERAHGYQVHDTRVLRPVSTPARDGFSEHEVRQARRGIPSTHVE